MISYETYCLIKKYAEQDKLKVDQIAKECHLSWLTVARWLKMDHYAKVKQKARSSKLDQYKQSIKGFLEKHAYSATQIYQKVRELGYPGSYTPILNYVNLVRPSPAKAYLTLSFAPGECAQVDWGSWKSVRVGSTNRKLSFFVMVLCHSRMLYVQFSVSQTMEHFLDCHQKAFEFFGGVPAKIMIDNLKSGVLRHLVGEAPIFNPRYIDFSRHFGFTPVACAPRKGNEKGRVERGVGYVKHNFLNGLEISDFAAIQPAATCWMNEIANCRVHGETKKVPNDVFVDEKKTLHHLPVHTYDVGMAQNLRVSSRFRVTYQTNHYSVPAKFASAKLLTRIYPDRLCIYSGTDLITTHPRCYDRQQDFENPDHVKELLAQRHNAKEQRIFARFLALSPLADDYYKQLCQRKLNPSLHIRKIVALSEIYSPDSVALAIADALTFQAFGSEYISNILEARSHIKVEPQGALILTHSQDLLELELEEPDLTIYEKKD
ncbi:MAG: IS21 family transposase [Bacillota bacterium]